MQTETMREKTFNMRLTPEEWARFEAVASHHALPVASMLRMLVKREADRALAPAVTYRAVTERAVADQTTTPDAIAIHFRIAPQLARNVLLRLVEAGVVKETTDSARLIQRPGDRTFRARLSLKRALFALEAFGISADALIQD
jgi:hypothetical protein